MKSNIKLNPVVLISLVFSSLLLLGSCNNDNSKCCEGFTGKVTDPRAVSLQKRCHFISKDSIEDWVARYEKYKEQLGRKQDYKTNNQDTTNAKADEIKAAMDEMSLSFLKGGSVSYNNCIIKKILCDKRSIGLRVLYGIGRDNRMHIILVGISADYSNLYVEAEDCCPDPLNKTLGAGLTSGTDARGGAEYGQMP